MDHMYGSLLSTSMDIANDGLSGLAHEPIANGSPLLHMSVATEVAHFENNVFDFHSQSVAPWGLENHQDSGGSHDNPHPLSGFIDHQFDLDHNGFPDRLDPMTDLDHNGVPERHDVGFDLDHNGFADRYDPNLDLNHNGFADHLDPYRDINNNLVPDHHDFVDMDHNGFADGFDCYADLNHNGIPDYLEGH
jgi:hypothetical protein